MEDHSGVVGDVPQPAQPRVPGRFPEVKLRKGFGYTAEVQSRDFCQSMKAGDSSASEVNPK